MSSVLGAGRFPALTPTVHPAHAELGVHMLVCTQCTSVTPLLECFSRLGGPASSFCWFLEGTRLGLGYRVRNTAGCGSDG